MGWALEGSPPTEIGHYDIIEQIGRGGMGVVYRARHHKIDRIVALKMILAGRLATHAERERFVEEIKTAARLAHANIVPIYEVGAHTDCPFFTMPVYSGTLRDQIDRGRLDPKAASKLMAIVARAVQHAHERGVLHRDLKPDNILVDEHGEPHVADFSVAMRIGERRLTEPGAIIGTRAYMAPEQARGDLAAITMAADQYSLGVVLFELVTGALPVAQAAREAEPPSPRSLLPTVAPDFEAICLKCLAPEPGKRYDSAGALADELDRFVRGEPTFAGPPHFIARAWRLARRHRLAVTAAALTIGLLVMTAASAVSVARAQENSALQGNAFAAEALAGEVASYLRAQLDDVVKLASDREISLQAASGGAEQWLKEQRKRTGFENLWLLDTRGKPIAVTEPAGPGPNSRWYLDNRYDWRDYFIGATLAREGGATPVGYISRVLKADVDHHYKFGVAAPFYDASGSWSGVIVAITDTSPTAFKDGRLVGHDGSKANAGDDPTVAALVAPQDRSHDDQTLKDRYVVIVHDGLEPGTGVQIDAPALRLLRQTRRDSDQLVWIERASRLPITSADHHDPVSGWSEARWLAAYAPVAQTGFVVIVQTRYDAWVTTRMLYPLVGVLGVAFLAWAAALGTSLWRLARRRGRQAFLTPGRAAAV